MKYSVKYIITTVILSCVIMNFIDFIIKPAYMVKSVIKICMFFTIPMIFFMTQKGGKEKLRKLFKLNKRSLIYSVIMGISLYIFIVGGYITVKGFVDFSQIVGSLGNIGVTGNNFLFVSFYIALFNSFLEEFFFRGFAFLTLKDYTSDKKRAYLFSSFIFAFYHMGMSFGWVEPVIYILEIIGLMIGGIIFNFLDEKTDSIYPSYLTHMFCNLAINTVGFMLFSIV